MQDGGGWGQACGMRRRREPRGAHALCPRGRGTFRIQIFIQPSSPEIWSETSSGGEEVLAGKWVGLFLGYLLGKNFRRRDRDHLVPPRRTDAAVCRAEVCYPFGSELRETLAVKRRAFITLLVAATTHEDTERKS